jgi:hypothetical protein
MQLLLGAGSGRCVSVFLGEALDAAGSVNELLLAGKERMAIGADFDVQSVAFNRGTRLKIVATSAVYGYGMIVGMNTGLHEISSLSRPVCAAELRVHTAASLGREELLIITGARSSAKSTG